MRQFCLIVCCAGLVLVPAPMLALTPFLTEYADVGEFVGTHTSIVIDAHGNPHISYKDEITIRLKYATKIGEAWVVEVVDDPVQDVGSYSSIGLDSNGNPHIAYYDASLFRPKLASRIGGVWSTQVIEDPAQDVGKHISLALDTGDVPHVAYYDDTLNRLKYAFRIGGNWIISVVHDPVEDVGQYASIALDGSQRPHIAYLDATTPAVRYAALFSNSWTLIPAGGDATTTGEVSLALDASGRAHIAYQRGSALYYAQNHDYPSWLHESVASSDGHASIAVDPAGTPRIAFYRAVPGAATVQFAVRTGDDQWAVEIADRAGFVGEYAALALDRQGNPRISYFDGGAGHLRYADASLYVREPAGGDVWPVGAERTIRWAGIGPVTLSLSVDGGRSYETLETGIIDQHVTVSVPHAPTRFARLRVSRQDPFATAESESLFTIDSSVLLMLLLAKPAVAGGVDIAWSTIPGPEDLAGYRVERRGHAGEWAVLAETSATSHHDPAGGAGSVYRLFAINGLGVEWLLGETRPALARPLAAGPIPFAGGELTITFGTSAGLGGSALPARLAVYDVSGRLVRMIDQGTYPAGYQTTSWDGRNASGQTVPVGTYFLKLTSGSEEIGLKVPVVR